MRSRCGTAPSQITDVQPNTGICVVFSRSANISAAFSLWGSWQETGSLRGGQALTHWSEVGPADRKQIITFINIIWELVYTNQAYELVFIDLLP